MLLPAGSKIRRDRDALKAAVKKNYCDTEAYIYTDNWSAQMIGTENDRKKETMMSAIFMHSDNGEQ